MCKVGAWLQRGENSNSTIISSCQEQSASRTRREAGPGPARENKTTITTTESVDSKNYVALFYIGGNEISLSFQSIMTFTLLQLPAVSLSFYGIFCAFCQQPKDQEPRKKIFDKITDSLLAMPIIIVPFCVAEISTLLLRNKIPATFDLLKFLPNKDPNGRDRLESNLLNVSHFFHAINS